MIKSFVASILLCNAVFLVEAQSDKKNKSIAIFSINKQPVAADEFVYLYRKNHQHKTDEFTKAKIDEYLQLFINFKLKVQEARTRGMDTTAAFITEYNTYREELRKPYLPDSRLVDSLVELTYNRLKEEVKAYHILISLKPDATPEDTAKAYRKIMELRTRTEKGEDFATLAMNYSEDPTAKINKGDLGYFTAMQMVFPFEQIAYSTRVGSTSMPLRTQFGYHIMKVADRRPSRGEVEVSHIMIRTGEEFDNEKAKNTIFDVYDQLQKGVKWEELSREYSHDLANKDTGGRLRPFGVGAMSGVPEFEQIAFSLQKPGDISDPFQTQYGWHIIRLENKIPLPPFETLATSLKNRVSRDERVQISKQVLQTKLKKEFGYNENSDTKSKAIAMGDSSLTAGKWKRQTTGSVADEVLFSMQGKSFTLANFLEYVRENQKPSTLSPAQYVNQLYDNYVDVVLGQLMEEKIMRQNPDYAWLLKEYYEGILLFEIMEKEVWNRATEDSIGQKQYFENNRAHYKAGERVSANVYSTNDIAALSELEQLLRASDIGKIQDFINAKKIKQESGLFEKTDKPVLAKIEWAKGIHKAENNGVHYLVAVKDVLPPGLRSFEEARPSVISDYQNYLEKKWLEGLKKKYPVKINKKGKDFAYQQLLKT